MHRFVKRAASVVTRAPQAPEPGAIIKKVDLAIRRGQFAQAIVEEIHAGVYIGYLPGLLPTAELDRPIRIAEYTYKHNIGIRVLFADQGDCLADCADTGVDQGRGTRRSRVPRQLVKDVVAADIVDTDPDQHDAASPGLWLCVHQINETNRLTQRMSHQLAAGSAADGKIVAVVVFARRPGEKAKSFIEIGAIRAGSPSAPFAEIDPVAPQPSQDLGPLPSGRAIGSSSPARICRLQGVMVGLAVGIPEHCKSYPAR